MGEVNHVKDENVKEEQPELPAAEVSEETLPPDEGEQEAPEIESGETKSTEEQAAEYLAGWQRALAELANYKKRTDRDRALWYETIRGDILLELLPVLDDFDRAQENLPESDAAQEWVNGILLIHRKLATQLEALGLEEISALGEPFNPEWHEAVMQENSDDHESGAVSAVLRKGYRIGEKVLRPALVRVAT